MPTAANGTPSKDKEADAEGKKIIPTNPTEVNGKHIKTEFC